MNLTARRARFREVLAADGCVRPASVYDPLSARMAETLGFEAGMLAGSVASLTVLGAPDLIVLTLSEFARQAHRICRASELPLMVDADHGYGNALNVMRTVEELETAGVCALSIEDTDLPPPHGAARGQRLLSLEEGVGKMKAAMAARPDPALVIFGRTSAAAVEGIAEAVRRVQAYEAAGVDGVFLVGLKTVEELDAVSAAVGVPIMLGGASPALSDPEVLAARGVRIALQGHQPVMAAAQAAYATLAALRAGTAPKALSGLPDPDLVARLTRKADYEAWVQEFLG